MEPKSCHVRFCLTSATMFCQNHLRERVGINEDVSVNKSIC
jgi:hypothetical protein